MSKMRVAVVGGGMSGLVAATELAKAGKDVVLYEKEDHLGGHARTITIDGIDLNTGFMFFNPATCPNLVDFFESNGIDMEVSDTSFSVSTLDKGHGCEWGSRHGLWSLFSQKKNVLNPYFWKMLGEIFKFKNDVMRYLEEVENNPDIDSYTTLGHFIESRGYSDSFQKAYLIPICASIWSSCPSQGVMSFSAYSVLSFFRNHNLLELFGSPHQWLTVRWNSDDFDNKVREELLSRGCQLRTGCEVHSVSTIDDGCIILTCEDGSQETYNGCVMAVDAPDALKMLGKQATYDEMRVLGAFQYVYCDIFLHRDKSLMPQNPAAWSACNFLQTTDNKACVTYWLNVPQNNIDDETEMPYLVTRNPCHTPEHALLKWSIGLPVPSISASKALDELRCIQGKRGIWFCQASHGHSFHGNELKLNAGLVAAQSVLEKSCDVMKDAKHMVPSMVQTGASLLVTRFLGHYISTGCLMLLEKGGKLVTFKGKSKKCLLKATLRVHNPQFYWKIATQADLGLADAYINGDFSLVDKDEGLMNLFMIFVANRELKASASRFNNKRGWWTPLISTAGFASAKYFLQHLTRQNTLTQARRNISRHYDLSNELFALFLDETMTYSCAIFKSEGEDLKVAQLRKISILIEKARIDKEHEILEIGCGWGSFAIEVVKRTGCKYTGITLSAEQLRFAEMKAKDAGLQDHIRFLLCDYRQLQVPKKYNRIISCEMMEHIGHENMENFFRCCESVMAEDGLLVVQFGAIPDERYDGYRRSSDFIKEYIFPGACVPSLSRVTSAMVASSRLCIEHVENIGMHYTHTLRCWRKNFLEQKSKILALGFDEKFIRTWEYYFDYGAAGFKTHTLLNYQIVISRPGNVSAFDGPSKDIQ